MVSYGKHSKNVILYANRVFTCKLCKCSYSDKYKPKAKKHANERPAMWIYEEWKPQTMEELKFIQS